MGIHETHHIRYSDAYPFDIMCVKCGRTDQVPGGWGKLVEPCPKAEVKPEKGEWK